MMRRCFVLTLIMLLFLFSLNCYAGNKILFFESKTSGDYKISSGFSKLREELRNSGYEVFEARAELSKEISTNKPDILVIPNLGQELTEAEMTSVYEFVIKEGKGLFIIGATPSTNKLTIPLGIRSMDEFLEDENSKVRDASTGQIINENTVFYINLPANRPDIVVNTLTKGVNKLYIFSGTGLYLFGNAKGVAFGGDYTNTPKSLVFPKGSYPAIAAYVRMNRGSIVLVSDADMFVNQNLDTNKYRHDNLKFAINIFDWLREPFQEPLPDEETDNIIKALKLQVLEQNRTIDSLNKEKQQIISQVETLTAEKAGLEYQISEFKKDKIAGIPWLSYQTAAMLVLAVSFIITTIVVLKKGRKPEKKKEKTELGYEFEEKTGEDIISDEDLEGVSAAKIKEEDVEARLRELQKNSK